MQKQFDHITVVVRDLDVAKNCFGLLGFREDKEVEPFAIYWATLARPGGNCDASTIFR